MADGSKGKLWTRADALAECNRVVEEYGARVANDIVEATRKIRQIGEDSGHRAIALHAFEELFNRIDTLEQGIAAGWLEGVDTFICPGHGGR